MKFIFLAPFIVSLIACSTVPAETSTTIGKEKTILRVSVKSAVWTEYFPEGSCAEYNVSDDDCIPWSYWRRYKAKVKEVVQGEYSSRSVTFVNLEHAGYIKEVTNNWYISLDKFDNKETTDQLEAQYYLIDHASEYISKESVDELLNGG